MTSVAIGFQQRLDHLSNKSSVPGVSGSRGIECFELVAYPALAFRDYSQESPTPKVRAGSDRQQAEGTEEKSDNVPRGSVVSLCSCGGRCEEGTSGNGDEPTTDYEQSHFVSISTHPF
nr:hypothetical protein 13 [bacterium]